MVDKHQWYIWMQGWVMSGWRIVVLSIIGFASIVTPTLSAATNDPLRVGLAFVCHSSPTTRVFVAGDPIRFVWCLTNTTDAPVTIQWYPGMFSARNVDLWVRTNGQDELLNSANAFSTLPRNIPLTTIPGRGSICLEKDLLDYYSAAGSLYGCSTSQVLVTPGEYVAAAAFFAFPSAEQLNGYSCSSPRVPFCIAPLDRHRIDALWPQVFDRNMPEERRSELAALLLVNLGGKRRNDFVRKCLDNDATLVRMVGIVGVERFRLQECLSQVAAFVVRVKEPEVRAYAISVLAMMDPVGCIPVLIQCVEQRQEGYLSAVEALGSLGNKRALPVLQKTLEVRGLDDDPQHERAADDLPSVRIREAIRAIEEK